MSLKQGDRVTLRSNKNMSGGLQPGDKGVVERVNADRGVVDVLWENGVRTVHVSWPSGAGRHLFLSTALLSAPADDDNGLPAYVGFYPQCKARLEALLEDTKKIELVEKVACLLATSSGDRQVVYLVWLLEVIEAEMSGDVAFQAVLVDVQKHIADRLETGLWREKTKHE